MQILFYFFRVYTKIPSFPHRRESERVRTETYIPSFPRISRHSRADDMLPVNTK
ncbi:PilS cassette [Neisseria meningitidis serogroup B]|uniref:PilS cassette n=1 Tax=Neisseria meningitidis serogroup B TaxID=491 RepID=A0A0H5E0A3_NEIMI|nr:PilS cassette [Neisseria meningitidis serogroup B]